MTGDARGEAERIVDRLSVLFGDFQKPRPDDEYIPDLVVAALAAAIEVAEDGAPVGNDYTGEALVECNHQVWLRLRDALSALRARAGEETG